MRLIDAAAGVLNQTPLDWDGNLENILAAIADARSRGVTLLCLPELCITGYGCEDIFHSPGVQEMAQRVLFEIVPQTQDMVVSVGLPVLYGGALFNTACLIANGRIAGLVGKQNLAGEGLHYEPRWFKPWPDGVRVEVALGTGKDRRNYPLGDLIFDCDGIVLGYEICEDAWVANRPGGILGEHGVDVILNPSASHFAFGKHRIRQRFVLEGSRAFHVSYIYANLLGNEAGRAIYDGDALIASCGKLLATAPRFSFADYHVTSAQIDIDLTRMQRARTASFKPRIGHRKEIVEVGYRFPDVSPQPSDCAVQPWERSEHLKEEEFSRAVSLGLFDYLRKSRSRGTVVSMSGGADSAACAVLSALMVDLAHSELGAQGLQAKLPFLAETLAGADDQEPAELRRNVVHQLLTCVYQSTRNSSDTTRSAAREVSEAVGARFLEFDVDPIFAAYVEEVSAGIGRELTWEQDDIALQNIQARVRSPGVWMMANLTGSLLLATSNRSEAAVGYATMDGDTSGGLSPIAGIDKAFLRKWLRWMETQGIEEHGPIAALSAVNRQQPTAELRPSSENQTDEDDLMPYEILDSIERAAIRDKKPPRDCYQLIAAGFPNYPARQLLEWTERFFRLWSRNQWKRERYAPSFHLDDENLDPKTWCRFPILSGGFERELKELRAWFERQGS